MLFTTPHTPPPNPQKKVEEIFLEPFAFYRGKKNYILFISLYIFYKTSVSF